MRIIRMYVCKILTASCACVTSFNENRRVLVEIMNTWTLIMCVM